MPPKGYSKPATGKKVKTYKDYLREKVASDSSYGVFKKLLRPQKEDNRKSHNKKNTEYRENTF